MVLFCRDDVWMADVEVSGGLVAGPRRRRSAVERRRIVEETLEAGASVTRAALKYGMNANQVFQWRRLHRDGKLGAAAEQALKLLPVSVTEEIEFHKPAPRKRGGLRFSLPAAVPFVLSCRARCGSCLMAALIPRLFVRC
jgi:transposase-like protein